METTKKRIKAIVVIETDMPDNCCECDHVSTSSFSDRLFCRLVRDDVQHIDSYLDGRAPFCPLIPVVEEAA